MVVPPTKDSFFFIIRKLDFILLNTIKYVVLLLLLAHQGKGPLNKNKNILALVHIRNSSPPRHEHVFMNYRSSSFVGNDGS